MLAIVIPYYKIDFFEQTLSSLAVQTNKNFSVFVGNDGSLQDPEEIMKAFSDLKINYYRFHENLGSISLSQHWERCIDMVNDEEWIMLLGDDDFLDETVVEKFYDNIEEVEEAKFKVIRYSSRLFWNEKNEFSATLYHPKIQNSTDAFYNVYFGSSRGSLSEHIFKKEAYLKKGFKDVPLAWGADNFAWLEFSDFGQIFSINDSIVNVRMSSQNISRNSYAADLKDLARYECFSIVVFKYLKNFTPVQRINLLMCYEQIVRKNRKITINFWTKMSLIYFKENHYLGIIKFSRRCLYYISEK